MKKILLAFLLYASSAIAQSVSEDTAIQVAYNYMTNLIKDNLIEHVEKKYKGDNLCLYKIIFNDSSWCLVSADMRVEPILAFGFDQKQEEDIPESFIKLIEWYKSQIDSIIKYDTGKNKRQIMWTDLISGKNQPEYVVGRALLDITGRGQLCWKQGKNNDGGCIPSYNQDCPSTIFDCYKCYHKPVGCAAVALGEILWYWRWSTIRAYDWDQMPSKLKNTTSLDSASVLTSYLRQCGESVNMAYRCTGSYATMDNIVSSLVDSHGYYSAHKIYKSDWGYGRAWNDIIKSEIDNLRPVIFYGDSWAFFDGHFFVVDGYQENNGSLLYHVNWGHGGSNNCFCKLDRFKEIIETENGFDTNYYDINNRAIVGISPTYYLNQNIYNVNYSIIPHHYYRNEYATNNIELPAINNTLTINDMGKYVIQAGNEVGLHDGFWAKNGSDVSISIDPRWHIGMAISVPEWPTIVGSEGYCISPQNADSWEFTIMDRNNVVMFQSAGSIRSDQICLWDGCGITDGAYLCIVTLKNSYGRSLHHEYIVTVINRSISDGTDTTTDGANWGKNIVNCFAKKTDSTTLQVIPNPSDGLFNIILPSDTIIRVEVYNTRGQLVYVDDNIMLSSYILNLLEFPRGNYIVVTRSRQKAYSAKFIKQ